MQPPSAKMSNFNLFDIESATTFSSHTTRISQNSLESVLPLHEGAAVLAVRWAASTFDIDKAVEDTEPGLEPPRLVSIASPPPPAVDLLDVVRSRIPTGADGRDSAAISTNWHSSACLPRYRRRVVANFHSKRRQQHACLSRRHNAPAPAGRLRAVQSSVVGRVELIPGCCGGWSSASVSSQ